MPYITLICEAGGARLVRVRQHYNKGMDMTKKYISMPTVDLQFIYVYYYTGK